MDISSFELLSRPHVPPLRSALGIRDHTGNSGSENWELCSQGGLQQPLTHGERGRMFIPIHTSSPAASPASSISLYLQVLLDPSL